MSRFLTRADVARTYRRRRRFYALLNDILIDVVALSGLFSIMALNLAPVPWLGLCLFPLAGALWRYVNNLRKEW